MSEADKIIENLKNSGRKVEEFYTGNKTSDKNVENIETVIKDCREHLKLYGEAFITADELDRIEKILAEREQDKKRIQELEKERDHWHGCFIVAMENSIAKEKVMDKIKEIKYLQSRTITREAYNIAQGEIIVLQELLEGGENEKSN